MNITYAFGRAWCLKRGAFAVVLEPTAAPEQVAAAYELLDQFRSAVDLADAIAAAGIPCAALVGERPDRVLIRKRVPARFDGRDDTASVRDDQGPVSQTLTCSTLELGDVTALEGTLFPFAGGVTRVSAIRVDFDSSAAPGIISRAAEVEASDTDELRVFSEPEAEGAPTLILPTGEKVALDRGAVIGRLPSSERLEGVRSPRLVSLGALSSAISRNHVKIEVTSSGLVATDLGSTNGTTLTRVGTLTQRLRPGIPAALLPGDVLTLGDAVSVVLAN